MPRRPLLVLALSLVLAAASYVPWRLVSHHDRGDPAPAAATWDGKLPKAGAAVTIPKGRRVLLDVSPPLKSLEVDGALGFADRHPLRPALPVPPGRRHPPADSAPGQPRRAVHRGRGQGVTGADLQPELHLCNYTVVIPISQGGSIMSGIADQVWRKSRHSVNSNCVEVALLEDRVAVRDSKQPQEGMLVFTLPEWRAFLAGARDGEFDPS